MSLTPKTVPTGAIRYNTDSNKMECFNGTKWMQIAVSSPDLDGGARIIAAGGVQAPANRDVIDYKSVASFGDFVDFGNLTAAKGFIAEAAAASTTRGVFGGGAGTTIDYITIASTGDAADFGDLTYSTIQASGFSNQTRGVFAGGYSPQPTIVDTINYVTIASTGNANDFGNLLEIWRGAGGCASPIRGLWCGGDGSAPTTISNVIQYVTIATTGNSKDFGDLTVAKDFNAAGSNSTRGVITGGRTPTGVDDIEYITMATFGNAIDFGETFQAIDEHAGTATSIRMFTLGGKPGPATKADVEYVTIATGGKGTDFGDLTLARHHAGAITNAHGGLG